MVAFFTACQSEGTAEANTKTTTNTNVTPVDLTGYQLTPSTNGWQLAERISEEGEIIRNGYVDAQGFQQGSWTSWEGPRSPSVVENYVDGKLHGARVEFDPVGRLRKIEHYKMGVLDGRYAEFRAAIPQVTATYRDGEYHGTYRAHTLQNGKVNRTIEYRNGKQDGPMRWYNDDEELIQERTYKNGELMD